jgi:hypothetical protein
MPAAEADTIGFAAVAAEYVLAMLQLSGIRDGVGVLAS